MLTLSDALLLVGLACVGAAAQLCLKRGAVLDKQWHFIKSLFRPWVIAGIVLMIVNMLALIWILRRLPLTSVMPITALVYILVPIGALRLFREKLQQPRFWFGALLIVTGIIVISA